MKIRTGQIWYCPMDDSSIEVIDVYDNNRCLLSVLEVRQTTTTWYPKMIFEQDDDFVIAHHRLSLLKTFKNLMRLKK